MAQHSSEWDSTSYHHISTPQVTWGKKVLARLSLRGDETVLDAGCGTGLLTAELLALLPRGRVVCLDLSANMLATAREHLAGNRAAFVQAGLPNLPFLESLDGVFSTATFHWVLDHPQLFRSIFQVLRPGGWLCAQCGGGPNIKGFLARANALSATPPFSPYLMAQKPFWEFSDAEIAALRLRRAGFIDIATNLESTPTRLATAAEYSEFIATAILRARLPQLPTQQLRDAFLDALTRQAANDNPPFELDYWRLNLQARKPA